MDTKKRSIAKALTFRIMATMATMALVLIFTKNLVLVGIVGILDLVSKLIIYYVHERVWNKLYWGRKE